MNEKTICYLLWNHDEDGPDTLCATLNPNNILDLLDKHFPYEDKETYDSISSQLVNIIAGFIDEAPTPKTIKLTSGWGGLHFQIIELE
jgi:hypothetical protein